MESLHGISSSLCLRGRRSFNGSHGGHGGNGRAGPKGNVQDYGRSHTQEAIGCDKGSFQGRNKGESAENSALVYSSICGNIGLPNKGMHEENRLDKASSHGCDERSSPDLKAGQKPDGAAPIISARCGISEQSITTTHGGRPMDKASDQGHDGRSSLGIKGGNLSFVTPSSPTNCGKEVLHFQARNENNPLGNSRLHGSNGTPSLRLHNGDKAVGVATIGLALGANSVGAKGEQPRGNSVYQGEAVRAVHDMIATKSAGLDLICGRNGLSLQEKNGEYPLGNSWNHGSEGGPSKGL
ncbi:hypothetical protein F0562_025468 [Nyssa sinensis]|uniref:Uncharacterized protein n=1 Tax=Nyssa sinensis TaxID=561372 RepID=A0A5J5B8V3_9ASTE|nr:hypothetical protein F0562_025468 [Nyssa sinensis]